MNPSQTKFPPLTFNVKRYIILQMAEMAESENTKRSGRESIPVAA
jgi:hypothetical protein